MKQQWLRLLPAFVVVVFEAYVGFLLYCIQAVVTRGEFFAVNAWILPLRVCPLALAAQNILGHLLFGAMSVETYNVYAPAMFLGVFGGIQWYLLVMLAVWLYRRTRGTPTQDGCCRSCGYDLTGNVSGICPECGKPMKAADGNHPRGPPES